MVTSKSARKTAKPATKKSGAKKATKSPVKRGSAASVKGTKPKTASQSTSVKGGLDLATKRHIGEVLKRAIKGEEDGYFFYNLLAQKADNPEARRKLEGLRDDEIRHKETLLAIYDKYVGGPVGKLPRKGINALAQVFRKGHLMDRRTEMEFLTLAIEAELAATKYYREERDLVKDREFREIFDMLAEEEHHHFELLQAEKHAITDNYHWFSYSSGAPLED